MTESTPRRALHPLMPRDVDVTPPQAADAFDLMAITRSAVHPRLRQLRRVSREPS